MLRPVHGTYYDCLLYWDPQNLSLARKAIAGLSLFRMQSGIRTNGPDVSKWKYHDCRSENLANDPLLSVQWRAIMSSLFLRFEWRPIANGKSYVSTPSALYVADLTCTVISVFSRRLYSPAVNGVTEPVKQRTPTHLTQNHKLQVVEGEEISLLQKRPLRGPETAVIRCVSNSFLSPTTRANTTPKSPVTGCVLCFSSLALHSSLYAHRLTVTVDCAPSVSFMGSKIMNVLLQGARKREFNKIINFTTH